MKTNQEEIASRIAQEYRQAVEDSLNSYAPEEVSLEPFILRALADALMPLLIPNPALQEAREMVERVIYTNPSPSFAINPEVITQAIAAALARRDERHAAELGSLARDSVAASNEIARLKQSYDCAMNSINVGDALIDELEVKRKAALTAVGMGDGLIAELETQLKDKQAVIEADVFTIEGLRAQLATARKDAELAEETIRAIQAVNVNEFGRVADLAISRLINTHYSAAMTAQEEPKPEGKPGLHRITSDNPPQFPCWLWCPQENVWSHATHTQAKIGERFTAGWWPFTHWHAGIERPTVQPAQEDSK